MWSERRQVDAVVENSVSWRRARAAELRGACKSKGSPPDNKSSLVGLVVAAWPAAGQADGAEHGRGSSPRS
ncbi:hypothetical protein QYE76_032689 [Lolium multiflorum]|uniref:Uncharacterized protein n=1 Tax=Lolium multiflorum TaxID=4521 RepID=A0AAD8QU74_LOLMU|nr:hypothetical protein QYE76_032689 [Lolium multiflorum]